jgi:hypothetical protein
LGRQCAEAGLEVEVSWAPATPRRLAKTLLQTARKVHLEAAKLEPAALRDTTVTAWVLYPCPHFRSRVGKGVEAPSLSRQR